MDHIFAEYELHEIKIFMKDRTIE